MEVRRAVPADRERVAEISARIWEGDDYVARMFDKWVADQAGYFAVVCAEQLILGLGKLTMLSPQDAWLEGLRVDPIHQGKGVAKLLTTFLLAEAERRGARSLRLSSYVENYASLHIVEKYGFRRIAEFKLFELSATAPTTPAVELPQLTDLAAISAGLDPSTLRQRGRLLAFDFTFEQLTPRLTEELLRASEWFGLPGDGGLPGLLVLSGRHAKDGSLSISYIQGQASYRQLIAAAAATADREQRLLYCMAPPADQLLQAELRLAGFINYNQSSDPDVFVYEYAGSTATTPAE